MQTGNIVAIKKVRFSYLNDGGADTFLRKFKETLL